MINESSALAKEFWQAGKGLDHCPIYDFHGHMHEMAGAYLPADSPAQMLHTMERANIASFAFCSHLALYYSELGERANFVDAEEFGGPLKCYLGVKSFDLDFDRDLKTLQAHPDVYIGFKFLEDYYGVTLEDPRHEPYWQYANDHHLPVLCHTWGGSAFDGAENVRAVARRYPNVRLILGHSIHDQWDKAVQLAKDFPNVYLELTAVLDDRGVLEYFVEEVGSERILFGTDLPWFSTFHAIGCILDAEITDEDRKNIFYRNGQRLLGEIGRVV